MAKSDERAPAKKSKGGFIAAALTALAVGVPSGMLLMDKADAASTTRTVKLCWTTPTTRANGALLPLSELKGYELSYRVDGSNAVAIPVASSATCTSVTLTLSQRVQPYLVNWSIVAIDTNNLRSIPSNDVPNSLDVPLPPSPPAQIQGLRVEISTAN